MVNLKKMSLTEILERKNDYSTRFESLEHDISLYLNNKGDKNLKEKIRSEYSALKKEIREEASYLNKKSNDIREISYEHNAYAWGS